MAEASRRPAARPGPDRRYVVARARDVPEGSRLLVEIEGREIGIFNVDGRLHAILNRCPHRGGALCKGDVLALVTADRPGEVRLDPSVKFIVCPWHGWEFDLETGQSWYEPGSRPGEPPRYPPARRFDLRVERGLELESDVVAGIATARHEGASFVDPRTRRIKGPYTAEMFPVDVEDDYIVISLRRILADG
jgi:nitrite reductase/ring-hydroxylating ferredoxin subunit